MNLFGINSLKMSLLQFFLDETPDIPNEYPLSTCLHYVRNLRDIKERFLELTKVSSTETSDVFIQILH